MRKTEETIHEYIKELSGSLDSLSETQRSNHLAEVEDHMTLFVKDQMEQGYSQSEIVQKIREEFLPAGELAKEFISESKEHGSENKSRWYLLGAVSVFLVIPFLFPKSGSLPLALLFFIFAYLVFTKKTIWGFFIIKHSQHRITNSQKVSVLGGWYLLLAGLLILLGNFIKAEYIIGMIVLLVLLFTFYIKKRFVQ
ncbi:HAAS signaling domain-containing protein [Bacillus massiliglaciei]|uniref:HAAS signaling domain-containing protein n=1 Tax=Bacillus massiliglaciei TaxID=1816693 RepID=UPI000DA5FD8D|nr:hypothetical protein [Bacillus massiliglaciei]